MAKEKKAPKKQVVAADSQTVVLKTAKDCKGSVKYACDNPGGLAIDNVYVYKDSPVMAGGAPAEISVTIARGKAAAKSAPAATAPAAATDDDEDEEESE